MESVNRSTPRSFRLSRFELFPGSTKAVLCLVVFLQLSCHQWMVNAGPVKECDNLALTITADNKLVLFIDGDEVTDLIHPNSPGIADIVPLSPTAQLVAVTFRNTGKNGGVLGSGPNFVTDASWKCTDQFYEGWQGVGFDDSTWPNAEELHSHGVKPWQAVICVKSAALWITSALVSSDKERNIYCRKCLVANCSFTSTEEPTTATTTQGTTQTPTPGPTPDSTPAPTPYPTEKPTPGP